MTRGKPGVRGPGNGAKGRCPARVSRRMSAGGPERPTRHRLALMARYGTRLRVLLSVLGVAVVGGAVLMWREGVGAALGDLGHLGARAGRCSPWRPRSPRSWPSRAMSGGCSGSAASPALHQAVPIVAADTALALSVSGGTLLGSGYARRRVTRAGADPALVSAVSWLALLLSAAVAGLVITLATAQTGDPVLNGLSVAALLLGVAGLVCAVQRPGLVRALSRRLGARWRRAGRILDAGAQRLARLRISPRDWGIVLFFGGWAAVVDGACLYACGRAVGAPASLSRPARLRRRADRAVLPRHARRPRIVEAGLYLTLVGRHVPPEAALTWTLAYRVLSFWGVLVVG